MIFGLLCSLPVEHAIPWEGGTLHYWVIPPSDKPKAPVVPKRKDLRYDEKCKCS